MTPDHYKILDKEVIDVIDDVLRKWQAADCVDVEFGFRMGNVIKYILRAPAKNKYDDLRKARNYLNLILQEYDKPGVDDFMSKQNIWDYQKLLNE